MDKIVIKGACEHNLKNIDLELPRDKFIVISGVSGSGKSSLAFDTIFAEGQRRYVESLSAYARQFLGKMKKPSVDYIEGLSPAISIEQKTTMKNPRSTVGTVTEIYDYYRLLFARIGTPHCPKCGNVIKEQSVDHIIDSILRLDEGSRISVLAPVVRGKKGEHQKVLDDARKSGFVRARIDDELYSLEDDIKLDKKFKHSISIIVDRIIVNEDSRHRISEAVETGLDIADGLLQIIIHNSENSKDEERLFSQKASCHSCGISIPEMQPRLFSFNNPFGACPECSGIGIKQSFDIDLIIPDRTLSFNEGCILTNNPSSSWNRAWFEALARFYDFSLDEPFCNLPQKIQDIIINGSDDEIDVRYINKKKNSSFEYTKNFTKKFPGILEDLDRRYYESSSSYIRKWLEKFMKKRVCSACGGNRLREEALAVKISNKNISDLTKFSIKKSIDFFDGLKLSKVEEKICEQILKEIKSRLFFLNNVGLEYLTLHRSAATLSGGEAQRIRLATQIGSQLVGVLYILDEPSIGLHQKDNERLLEALKHLRDLGNTLVVVEHDYQTLVDCDYLVDLGVGAGEYGGSVIACGTPKEVMKVKDSLTGQFLSGAISIDSHRDRRKGNNKFIEIFGAKENNLKNIDVKIPLGKFNVITGISGSGKSTLLESILYPAIHNKINRSVLDVGEYDRLEGIEHIDKIINIDQSPIGRTPRSCPATYIKVFTHIRELYSMLPESKSRGYKPGRFSFNVSGGRCENCGGDGQIKIEMHFLPDVHIMCDECKGKRYNKETLDIRYKGKNIHDVLEMSVSEALIFFEKHPQIVHKLKTIEDVGLGYIKLGQSALTLSGGEAQRVKLASELIKKNTGNTLYIIDEPTTGLHFVDVKKLLEVLQLLVDNGNTVILIEHNLDVIKQADYVIDLGPDGGENGGTIVAEGTPEELSKCKKSYTGQFLREIFEGDSHKK